MNRENGCFSWQKNMENDYLIRASAPEAGVRAFALTSRDLVEEARKRHSLRPVASAALGRLMSGALMMGAMGKEENGLLTIRIDADGPLKSLTVTATSKGTVKGYVGNPDVVLPPNAQHKLDVGGAVGNGFLRVTRDSGIGEPYSGEVPLQTGEIAEDLTYYFAASEQIPSSVGLGVLVDRDESILCAGGFILQLLPDAPDETIAALEKALKGLPSVTELLQEEVPPEGILERLLGEFSWSVTEKAPVRFLCDCSRERVKKALYTLRKEDMEELLSGDEPTKVHCHFCNTDYEFTPEELKKM